MASHFFASDAPVIQLSCGEAIMGDTVRKRMGSQVEVRYQCIDSAGLQLIRIVANGKPVKELRPTDDNKVV